MGKNCTEQALISLILRLAIALIFAVAALSKFMMGLDASVLALTGMFKDAFLPAPLVTLYAQLLPFVEAIIAVWLLSGVKLKEAWLFTAITLLSLGFGLMVAKQSAADVYIFVLMACAGLHFSQHDTCCFGKKKV